MFKELCMLIKKYIAAGIRRKNALARLLRSHMSSIDDNGIITSRIIGVFTK